MFYVSKVSPFFFLVGIVSLVLSLFMKLVDTHSFTFFTLLVFGFVGSVLIGAMYQIVPNSQNRKLSWHRVSYGVFGGVFLSLILLYFGHLKTGSIILSLSYCLFLLHVVLNIKNWMPVTVKFLGVSALYLALSSVFLALHLNYGFVSLQLAIHTLTLGAMLNAVYGVEIAWIPMLLMETLNISKAKKLFYLKQASTLAMLFSFFLTDYRLISVVALTELAVFLYFGHLMFSLIKHRRMPSPIPNVVKAFLLALIFLPVGFIFGMLSAGMPQALHKLYILHIDLVLYGFTAFTIFGGITHLLPRIVWNWKLAHLKGKAPPINELVNEKSFIPFLERAVPLFVLFVAVDSLPSPLSSLSPLLYIVIVGDFIRITFLHLIRKIREVKYGGDKVSGDELSGRQAQ